MHWFCELKFIYSEKAAKFCKIFPLLLTVCTVVKSKGKISQNFLAFSEYLNFKDFTLDYQPDAVWAKHSAQGLFVW